jgi:hypothetical protein
MYVFQSFQSEAVPRNIFYFYFKILTSSTYFFQSIVRD